MVRDDKTYLYDIAQSCRNIRQFTNNLEFQAYAGDLLVKSAVERQFILIGEALNNLKRLDGTVYNKIPYAGQNVGFRNILRIGLGPTRLGNNRKVCQDATGNV